MDIVSLRQLKAEKWLGLSIPVSDFLSYRGSRLFTDATTVSERI